MKYLDAYLTVYPQSQKAHYEDVIQQFINVQFDNASDVWTIQEETYPGSAVFNDIEVRVNYVISSVTGKNRGDDWKKILFKDIAHQIKIGTFFIFDSNYWLTISTENIKNLTSTCIVRRCNNTLRWIDEDGGYHVVPCMIDYDINENRDYSTTGSALVIPSGTIQVYTQLNSKTNKIKANQRFLFGNSTNWVAYKVLGGGINNYGNLETADNTSAPLLKLTMGTNYINEESDDLVNGVADIEHHSYQIVLSRSSVTGNIGNIVSMSASVTLSDLVVERNVVWSSSDDAVASVDSAGRISMNSLGYCAITCSLENNPSIHTDCVVEVVKNPLNEYLIVFSPDDNFILENDAKTYAVKLYLNNVLQADTFTFTIVAGNVPEMNYIFTVVDGYRFTVENRSYYLDEPLVVRADDGTRTKDFEIYLRGAW